MASPLLNAPQILPAAHPSPAASPANSTATAATFGAGPRSPRQASGADAAQNRLSRAEGNSGLAAPSHDGRHLNLASRSGIAIGASNGNNSTAAHVIEGPGGRLLCVADVRGNLSSLNKLAAEADAQAIIHTGDFGFYESESFERISDRTLRHLVQYSTLIPTPLRSRLLSADVLGGGASNSAPPPPTTPCKEMRAQMLSHPDSPLLTEFPAVLSGKLRFNVPVYTVWGACEDVRILEKIRTGEYAAHNLHILDEASTKAIEVGGVRLRLFGLGGAVVLHKMFDNGEGAATIAGGQGTMWTTILQIGELVDTAQRCYDATETRVLVTHASPGREGLLMQLALALKADLTISAGLHFRYGVSYNEFSVQSETDQFRRKLLQSKSAFGEVWESVRDQMEKVVDDQQRILLNNGLAVTNRVPNAATATGAVHEEPAWKNTWNWNLPDAAFGHLVLDVRDGRVSSEMKSQGFNFAYRRAEANNVLSTAVTTTPAALQTTGAAASPGIPTGPARMRRNEGHGAAIVPSTARSGSGSLPPKSPKQYRSPSQSENLSRPASSRGATGAQSDRSGDESGVEVSPRGARGGASSVSPSALPPVSASADTNRQPTKGPHTEPGLIKSTSNASIRSNANSKAVRGRIGKKVSSATGFSSRSEKSGSESEGKHNGKAVGKGNGTASGSGGAREVWQAVSRPTDSDTTTENKRGGGSGRGRGGNRGGRGVPRGNGRGGSQSQERRKPSGTDDLKGSTGGAAAGESSAPAKGTPV